jgi:hypothetical protein
MEGYMKGIQIREATKIDKQEFSRGRPRDITQSKYYPAIDGALKGRIMCIELESATRAISTYQNIRNSLARNRIEGVKLCVRKNKLFVYPLAREKEIKRGV